jgi:hypothetical protein
MAYGTIKVDTITFTDGGVDKSVSVSGLVENPTFTGNVTATGTISGDIVRGQTISGVTVTGITANFTSGNFTNISGGTHTITSGVFALGTAANPSISFVSDPNTGIYSPGADQVAISTNGVQRIQVDSAGSLLVATTTNPTTGTFPRPAISLKQLNDSTFASAIHIEASADQSVLGIGYNGSAFGFGTSYRSTGAFKDIFFSPGGTEKMRLDSSGRLGLGTSSPIYRLQTEINHGTQSPSTLWRAATFQSSYTRNDNSDVVIRRIATGVVNYSTFLQAEDNAGNTVDLSINPSGGRVGIGTTSPGTILHAASANAGSGAVAVRIQDTTASQILDLMRTGPTYSYIGIGGNEGVLYSQNTVTLAADTSNPIKFCTGGSERMRLDSSGRLGLGTSSPSQILGITTATNDDGIILTNSSANGGRIRLASTGTGGRAYHINVTADGSGAGGGKFVIRDNTASDAARLTIDSSGNVGIGTAVPGQLLHVSASSTDTVALQVTNTQSSITGFLAATSSTYNFAGVTASRTWLGSQNGVTIGPWNANTDIRFVNSGNEKARIDSSGRLLVGTSTAPTATESAKAKLVVNGNTDGPENQGELLLNNGADIIAEYGLGVIYFGGESNGQVGASISATAESAWNTSGDTTDSPGRLVFSTTADGASSPTERMRIDQAGRVGIGKTPASSIVGTGIELHGTGLSIITRSAATPLIIHRTTDDGNLVEFYQDTNLEGTISVSGTTVSYNGGHLARWSQLLNNQDPSDILKGTVMSNLDEMCDWDEEDNEQLNKTKISDLEGDPDIAGVFVSTAFDNNGPLDFLLAMTGDMIIRIAEGVTIQRGDLLMSAGDGTAKPQDDDIIRSKTIAKVTSTHVTCTYDDGSYCVPCVLMAC